MPILDDIMDHEFLGPKFRRERKEGRVEGERAITMRQIERRFGPVPAWAGQRLKNMTAAGIEEIALRLLDARSLEDPLGG